MLGGWPRSGGGEVLRSYANVCVTSGYVCCSPQEANISAQVQQHPLRLSGTGERWNGGRGPSAFFGEDADRPTVSAARRSTSYAPPDARSGEPSARSTVRGGRHRAGLRTAPARMKGQGRFAARGVKHKAPA